MLLGTWIVIAIVPRLDDSEIQTSRHRRSLPQELASVTQGFLQDHPEVLHGNVDEIIQHIMLDKAGPNFEYAELWKSSLGTELSVGDEPGNFTVEKRDGYVVVRVYDQDGRVFIHKLPCPVEHDAGKSSDK